MKSYKEKGAGISPFFFIRQSHSFLGPVVLVWYIVTELGSIVENAGALGAPIPAFLQAAIQSLNQAVDGSDPRE